VAKPKNTNTEDTENTENTEQPTGGKGQPRPRAAVEVIDFSDVADEADLAAFGAGSRTSKWSTLLDDLYDATAADDSQVPRDEAGTLKFVRLGTFNNAGGARTQVKFFEDKGLDATYEFKTVVKGKQSFLWARVREVEA
jgi:hypothetical protein